MGVRVPHRLGLAALVPLALRAPPGGDGVNDLPVSEGVTFPAKMGIQIPRGPGGAGPDNEPQPRLIQGRQIGRREHAGVSDHHELLNTVSGLEGLHNGNDRGGLGLVALPAADLERKTSPVNQQPDDDLRGAPPLLGVTDLAQVVLTLGLEVQGGDVVQAQDQAPGGGDVLEQGSRQALAVAPLRGPGQAGLQGVAVGRGWPADLGQDSGVSALEVGSIKRATTICSKARSPPTASPSPRRA